MAVLVCGGAGYVGSHTVAELVERGYEVVVLDNLEKGHKDAVWPGASFCECDLRDEKAISEVFDKHAITDVIDFAAYSLVAESVQDPKKYYENNVVGTMNLLKVMHAHDVKRFVFSSTASTYGEPQFVPITEEHRNLPTNPYGESKLAVERILKWYDGAYGIKSVALRYFNVAGAHKSGKIGEDHTPETHLIPIVLSVAAKTGKLDKLMIYGNDYPTEDGTCIRDYIHITDLADAHILALEKLKNDSTSAIYNLGNGKGFSNLEILETAKRVTKRDIPYEFGPRRPGDPSSLIASSEKIMKELGWKPTHTDLADIIESAWKWHVDHPNGFDK